MKITVWTLVKTGSHGELVVTTHATKDEARKMLMHALKEEEITSVGHACHSLEEAPLSELKQAWEVHFDGQCLVEWHEVDVPLTELDKLIHDLRNLVTVAKLEKAA